MTPEPEFTPDEERLMSRDNSAKGRLQRAALRQLRVHVRDDTLPTNERFLFYELEHLGVVSKVKLAPKDGCTTVRTSAQNLSDALLHLREVALAEWEWLEDETRTTHGIRTAPTIAEYLDESLRRATIDRWAGEPAPLIICESRSLSGVLQSTADEYACPITSTNGQSKGHIVTNVVPWLETGGRVLYFGDLDLSGEHIEDNTRDVLCEYSGAKGTVLRASGRRRPDETRRRRRNDAGLWERVAITERQLAEVNAEREVAGLGDATIMKTDMRHRDPVTGRKGVAFPAVETEVMGQARIVAALTARLDELMPEPLEDVRVRQERQRDEVAEMLRRMRD